MRLKQIKLAGFKSFVDPTLVPFPQQMTAVVGPNGCGKSNVIDAVRWVLGESSAKNLRGDAMTDVIFNGSSQRKPVSQASVELVFENTQGRISGNLADRSEISIKRLVTRDAQSHYFLNGTKCRRRDITDIFLGTGLGPRSYAIIEQGMISRLIESKPQELRVFIEEAAGISKYKERRRETENRIKHTRENLDRLSDVREELGKNIEKLKRQATAAQRYKELKAQERKLKAELTTLRWLKYNTQLTQLEQQLRQHETELEKFLSDQSGGIKVLTELKEQAVALRQTADKYQAEFYQSGNSISRLEQQILHQRQQKQQLDQQLQQQQQAMAALQQHLLSEQSLSAELAQQLEQDEPQLAILQEQLDELQHQLYLAEDEQQQQQQVWQQWQQTQFALKQQQQQLQLQLQNQQQQINDVQQQQLRLQQDMADLTIQPLQLQIVELEARAEHLHVLYQQQQQQCDATEQQYQQAMALLQQYQQQLQQLEHQLAFTEQEKQRLQQLQLQHNKAQQQLLVQLQVEPGWALAVSVALGQLQHAAISSSGQEALAPYVTSTTLTALAGTLSSKIISGVYPETFLHILLAENQQQARQLLASASPEQSVISKDGYWFGHNWGLVAVPEQQDSFLLRQQRLTELLQQLEHIQQQHNSAEQQLQQQQDVVQNINQTLMKDKAESASCEQRCRQHETSLLLRRQELQQAQRQQLRLAAEQDSAEMKLAQLAESIEQQTEQLEQVTEQLMQHELQQQQLQLQQNGQQQQLQQQRQQLELCRQQHQQLLMQLNIAEKQQQSALQNISRSQQQLRQLTEQAELLSAQLSSDDEPELLLHEQLQQALLNRDNAEQQLAAQQNLLSGIEQQIRELEMGQQGTTQIVEQKRRQIEELRLDSEGYRVRANNMLELLREQQVNMKDIVPELSAEADENSWQQQLDKTTDAVSRLGPINLAAIEEYEQQAERKLYLDTQHQDLTSALETLETAIRKIDKETRQKFKETFEQVNEGLKALFPKVFGGGSAYLDLTEDDLLETGVTIMARPPGKKNSTIHLLSGGEKALTALSLVFSIFRLNPAPFCMLDEVDAPLDDANVGRFCNLVREMSETVQFIYISHNKIAMEMAAQLMGVTMQEPGVSRVVAVDVEDAVKMAATS